MQWLTKDAQSTDSLVFHCMYNLLKYALKLIFCSVIDSRTMQILGMEDKLWIPTETSIEMTAKMRVGY